MSFRTTLVLFALALGIGLFIGLYERNRPNTEEANRRAQNLINFERDKIDGLVIQNGDERIELKRTDKKWRLESPVKDLADGSTVENLVFDLEELKKDATISGKEIESDKNKLSEFGVAKAKLRLKLLGQNAPPEILFGNNAALEGKTYVRLENSKDVFIASQSIKTQISKKPEEFRDRKLTDAVATQVTRLSLKTAAGASGRSKSQRSDRANNNQPDRTVYRGRRRRPASLRPGRTAGNSHNFYRGRQVRRTNEFDSWRARTDFADRWCPGKTKRPGLCPIYAAQI